MAEAVPCVCMCQPLLGGDEEAISGNDMVKAVHMERQSIAAGFPFVAVAARIRAQASYALIVMLTLAACGLALLLVHESRLWRATVTDESRYTGAINMVCSCLFGVNFRIWWEFLSLHNVWSKQDSSGSMSQLTWHLFTSGLHFLLHKCQC